MSAPPKNRKERRALEQAQKEAAEAGAVVTMDGPLTVTTPTKRSAELELASGQPKNRKERRALERLQAGGAVAVTADTAAVAAGNVAAKVEAGPAAAAAVKCSACGQDKPPLTSFSRKMLTKPAAKRKCSDCVAATGAVPNKALDPSWGGSRLSLAPKPALAAVETATAVPKSPKTEGLAQAAKENHPATAAPQPRVLAAVTTTATNHVGCSESNDGMNDAEQAAAQMREAVRGPPPAKKQHEQKKKKKNRKEQEQVLLPLEEKQKMMTTEAAVATVKKTKRKVSEMLVTTEEDRPASIDGASFIARNADGTSQGKQEKTTTMKKNEKRRIEGVVDELTNKAGAENDAHSQPVEKKEKKKKKKKKKKFDKLEKLEKQLESKSVSDDNALDEKDTTHQQAQIHGKRKDVGTLSGVVKVVEHKGQIAVSRPTVSSTLLLGAPGSHHELHATSFDQHQIGMGGSSAW